MTLHGHREYVPGCVRCELSRDEAMCALREEAQALGFSLTDDRLEYVATVLDGRWVMLIPSRRAGREYALEAAAAIAKSRKETL